MGKKNNRGMTRRRFLASTVAASTALWASPLLGQGRPRVVVIGGGAGGATAARYIAKDSKGAVDVTLVEPTRRYYSCFFSNLYLGGFREFESLGHSYGTLAAAYGINVVHDWAVSVDRDKKTVGLAGGGSLAYDRLVLSPGIDFRPGSVRGWDLSQQNRMPHAYKAGSQTQLLKAQVAAMRKGGVYCMVAPPNPFRCPPGPYERISMVAHTLKQSNPTAKILIVDPRPSSPSRALRGRLAAPLPGHGRAGRPGLRRRQGRGAPGLHGGGDRRRGDEGGRLQRHSGAAGGPHRRGRGITNKAGWVPVVPHTMQSRADENIHVLGDASQQGDMPKSGFSANSQAKVCAMAVRGALTKSKVFPARFSNTCWSLIGTDDGVKVGASYKATDEKIAKTDGFISKTGESAELRKATYEESIGWYAGISKDIFG